MQNYLSKFFLVLCVLFFGCSAQTSFSEKIVVESDLENCIWKKHNGEPILLASMTENGFSCEEVLFRKKDNKVFFLLLMRPPSGEYFFKFKAFNMKSSKYEDIISNKVSSCYSFALNDFNALALTKSIQFYQKLENKQLVCKEQGKISITHKTKLFPTKQLKSTNSYLIKGDFINIVDISGNALGVRYKNSDTKWIKCADLGIC